MSVISSPKMNLKKTMQESLKVPTLAHESFLIVLYICAVPVRCSIIPFNYNITACFKLKLLMRC